MARTTIGQTRKLLTARTGLGAITVVAAALFPGCNLLICPDDGPKACPEYRDAAVDKPATDSPPADRGQADQVNDTGDTSDGRDVGSDNG